MRQYTGPAARIYVVPDLQKNADFAATRQTMLMWETEQGRVSSGAQVTRRTGSVPRTAVPARFMNGGADDATHHRGFAAYLRVAYGSQRRIRTIAIVMASR